MQQINSKSVGDPAKFHSLQTLEQRLAALPDAPASTGRVALIIRRTAGGLREYPARAMMTLAEGLPGDAWGRQADRTVESQLAVIQWDVAELIANGQPLGLSGDNLILELDLSAANLPPGSRLRVGYAVMKVTPMPHNGCRKFKARFGPDALHFVSKPDLRHRNLRGIYLRVEEPGEVAVGDRVEVLERTHRVDPSV
ncbi:MAG: MOSC domain-containing protein [Planctomycetales bacterium]